MQSCACLAGLRLSPILQRQCCTDDLNAVESAAQMLAVAFSGSGNTKLFEMTQTRVKVLSRAAAGYPQQLETNSVQLW